MLREGMVYRGDVVRAIPRSVREALDTLFACHKLLITIYDQRQVETMTECAWK